jgi:hypothetical protein
MGTPPGIRCRARHRPDPMSRSTRRLRGSPRPRPATPPDRRMGSMLTRIAAAERITPLRVSQVLGAASWSRVVKR